MTLVEKLVKQGLTEEQAKKVADNFGEVVDGLYVTKTRFNEINEELKTANNTIKERDTQLETLKNSTEDVEGLKTKIKTLQDENKTAKAEAEKSLIAERKNNAIKLELTGKVHNMDITLGQIKLDEIIMNEDGSVKSGLKEQVEGLKKSSSFLFVPEGDGKPTANPTNPIKGATPRDGEPGGAVDPNLSKAEVFAKNLATNNNKAVSNDAMAHYFGDSK